MICVISRNLHPFFNSAHKCLSIPRVDTLDVCTSCSRCQVAMLLINPNMHKESMPILIMLLHAVDPIVDTGVDAFLCKEIFVRIFLLRAILTNLGAMIFISGFLFQMGNLPLYILFILVTFLTIFYCSTSFAIYYFL